MAKREAQVVEAQQVQEVQDPMEALEGILESIRKVKVIGYSQKMEELVFGIDREATRIRVDLQEHKARLQAAEAAQTSAKATVRNLLAAGLEDQAKAVAAALSINLEEVRKEMATQPARTSRTRSSNGGTSEKKKPFTVIGPDGNSWKEYSIYTSCRSIARKEGLAKNYLRPGTAGGFDSREFEKVYGVELGHPFRVAGKMYTIKKEEEAV